MRSKNYDYIATPSNKDIYVEIAKRFKKARQYKAINHYMFIPAKTNSKGKVIASAPEECLYCLVSMDEIIIAVTKQNDPSHVLLNLIERRFSKWYSEQAKNTGRKIDYIWEAEIDDKKVSGDLMIDTLPSCFMWTLTLTPKF